MKPAVRTTLVYGFISALAVMPAAWMLAGPAGWPMAVQTGIVDRSFLLRDIAGPMEQQGPDRHRFSPCPVAGHGHLARRIHRVFLPGPGGAGLDPQRHLLFRETRCVPLPPKSSPFPVVPAWWRFWARVQPSPGPSASGCFFWCRPSTFSSFQRPPIVHFSEPLRVRRMNRIFGYTRTFVSQRLKVSAFLAFSLNIANGREINTHSGPPADL
jgi:hypothetical protein